MNLVFTPGQRWFSETEPELGLGMVLASTGSQVTVVFRATGTTRVYSIEYAPLKRLQFRAGETIRGGEKDEQLKVTEVTEENGLLHYHCNGTVIPETLLSDQLSINTPRERLLAGHVDESGVFDLRSRTWQLLHEYRKSPVRGLVGGRVALIPHQLYIASEVTQRINPRVLLADEVGLGKTIESCLIFHRLHLTGRVSRVLILVPESLVHQWFVELYRRFNMWFAIFDEERCAAIEQHDPGANPFAENQLIIASIDLLAQKPARAQQAVEAGWEMLIVDEAHHLQWSAEAPSREYLIVEQLAQKAPTVLLLTATPEQLGEASHFARLRLLDPNRFADLEQYLREHGELELIAGIANKLIGGESLDEKELEKLASLFSIPVEEVRQQAAGAPAELVKRLLDQHGTGRVMFRNTRAAMSGFPKRIPHLYSLKGEKELDYLEDEFFSDLDPRAPQPDYEFEEDPRVEWLAGFLRSNPGEKVLLLCRYREKAEAIESALRDHINVKAALFHEKLPLIQRDRNAAWFAEEDGAQILICSEIGSEGRNFQFAHHLVLFDLPANPELLEQRIGRLDRIGQTGDIHIHVPSIAGSPQEKLARWYDEGVNCFGEHFSGGAEMFEKFHSVVVETATEGGVKELNQLLKQTKAYRKELDQQLHSGRDRLLEMHSFNAEKAAQIASQVAESGQDTRLDALLVNLFDHFGVRIEELGNRTFSLGAGDLFKEKIPGLPEEGLVATAERTRALSREDIAFLSPDHPVVTSIIDMLLGSPQGNTAFALWPNAPSAGVLVESFYILEPLAPAELQLDRFLPPTPIRVVLNHKRKEAEAEATPEALAANLKNGDPAMLADQMEELGSLLPGMIRVSEVVAGKRGAPLIAAAVESAKTTLGAEIERLEQLRRINPSVRQDEIDTARNELARVEEHLGKAAVRLDAVRLILASAGANKPAATTA